MKPFLALSLCALWFGGCIIRHEEDSIGYDDDDALEPSGCTGGTGSSATGGDGSGGVGATGAGGNGVGGGSVEPPPPACRELASEGTCSARPDCTPIYAGTDCSCGPECTCVGGEPGCVCESFGFLVCIAAE